MTRSDRISANVGRLLAATVVYHGVLKSDLGELGVQGALKLASAIEDAVDKAERARITPKESTGLSVGGAVR